MFAPDLEVKEATAPRLSLTRYPWRSGGVARMRSKRTVLRPDPEIPLQLNQQILAYDREIENLARHSEPAQRLMTLPGVGAVTATALVASIADPKQFDSGRQLAAWLGLVPRQYGTGGKTRLGRITKQGDKYLRTLLIHGTRAVLAALRDKQDRTSCWLRELIARRGYKRAAVALAAKNARIVWAMLVRGEAYRIAPAIGTA